MARIVKIEEKKVEKKKIEEVTRPESSEVIPYNQQTATARMRITVQGVYALMTHNPESMSVVSDAKRGSRIPSAEDEAEAGTYRMEDGTCALKGDSFRAAILAAAGAWKVKRATMKSRLSHITIEEELIPLQRHDDSAISDYVIDARRAIVQKQGIIRHRPKFEEWRCSFVVVYDPVLVGDPKLIADICADAGGRIGVGDFRPAKNGPFGRYRVDSYQLL
jgi:hypothetical protein